MSNYIGARNDLRQRWLKEETVEEIVQLAWARASSVGHGPKLMEKANAVHADLHGP